MVVSQLCGLVLAAALAALRGEPTPSATDVGWAILAGTTGSVGLTALYQGLASGRMAVVAPLAGVIAAALPVLVGVLTEGSPGPVRGLGTGLGLVAVVLLGRSADPGALGRAEVGLALAAGLGFGLFSVTITRVADGLVFGPLVAARATSALVLAAVVAARRWRWRVPAGLLPGVAVVGVLDMTGNGLFIAAAGTGRLDVAAVLSSLYPVSTIVLAALVLRERVQREHALGIVVAGVAIALIAGG